MDTVVEGLAPSEAANQHPEGNGADKTGDDEDHNAAKPVQQQAQASKDTEITKELHLNGDMKSKIQSHDVNIDKECIDIKNLPEISPQMQESSNNIKIDEKSKSPDITSNGHDIKDESSSFKSKTTDEELKAVTQIATEKFSILTESISKETDVTSKSAGFINGHEKLDESSSLKSRITSGELQTCEEAEKKVADIIIDGETSILKSPQTSNGHEQLDESSILESRIKCEELQAATKLTSEKIDEIKLTETDFESEKTFVPKSPSISNEALNSSSVSKPADEESKKVPHIDNLETADIHGEITSVEKAPSTTDKYDGIESSISVSNAEIEKSKKSSEIISDTSDKSIPKSEEGSTSVSKSIVIDTNISIEKEGSGSGIKIENIPDIKQSNGDARDEEVDIASKSQVPKMKESKLKIPVEEEEIQEAPEPKPIIDKEIIVDSKKPSMNVIEPCDELPEDSSSLQTESLDVKAEAPNLPSQNEELIVGPQLKDKVSSEKPLPEPTSEPSSKINHKDEKSKEKDMELTPKAPQIVEKDDTELKEETKDVSKSPTISPEQPKSDIFDSKPDVLTDQLTKMPDISESSHQVQLDTTCTSGNEIPSYQDESKDKSTLHLEPSKTPIISPDTNKAIEISLESTKPQKYSPDTSQTKELSLEVTKPVEIPPEISKTFEISPDVTKPVEIPPEISKTFEISPDVTKPVEIPPEISKTFEISPEVTKLVEISCDNSETLDISLNATKPVENPPDISKTPEISPESDKLQEICSEAAKILDTSSKTTKPPDSNKITENPDEKSPNVDLQEKSFTEKSDENFKSSDHEDKPKTGNMKTEVSSLEESAENPSFQIDSPSAATASPTDAEERPIVDQPSEEIPESVIETEKIGKEKADKPQMIDEVVILKESETPGIKSVESDDTTAPSLRSIDKSIAMATEGRLLNAEIGEAEKTTDTDESIVSKKKEEAEEEIKEAEKQESIEMNEEDTNEDERKEQIVFTSEFQKPLSITHQMDESSPVKTPVQAEATEDSAVKCSWDDIRMKDDQIEVVASLQSDKEQEIKIPETGQSENKDGEHDSGVDESTQGKESVEESPSKKPAELVPTPAKLPPKSSSTPKKSPTAPVAASPAKVPKPPSSTSSQGSTTATSVQLQEKKIPMNKVVVGTSPSPNLKVVKSKIGSLENAHHRAGGGNVKVETKKVDISGVKSKIGSTDNIQHKPTGGEKKILSRKLEWKGQSKVGSLDNTAHKPGGGGKKIETVKLNFKDAAKSKVGSRDNIQHKAGGGTLQIEEHKLNFKDKAKSKVGSMDNVTHKAGGGNIQIFDEKLYYTHATDEKKSERTDSPSPQATKNESAENGLTEHGGKSPVSAAEVGEK